MKADYETGSDDDAGGGDYVGGGLHSGGGYTVLGGGFRSFGGGGIGSSGLGPGSGGRGGGSGSIAGMSAADLDAMAAAGNFPDSPAGRAAFIRSNAMKMGVDPDYVLSVAKSEGLFSTLPNHQNLSGYNVFGDFQLNYSRGVGVAAKNAGIDPSDWKRSDLFAMNWMKVHGMNDWLASGHSGPVPLYHGVDHDKVMASPVSGLKSGEYISHDSAGRRIAVGADGYALRYLDAAVSPPVSEAYPDRGFHSHTVHAASLNAASSGGAGTPVEIHVHSHLDGKRVAHSVQKHVVRANNQIFGPSMHDKLGSLSTPDAGYQTER